MRERTALVTTFEDPDTVSQVYFDPPPDDGDGEFIDLIEDAACPTGQICTYLDNRCVHCGEPAPWVRGHGCGLG